MNGTAKIALLIDADNTQIGKLDYIVRIASSRGRVVLKRAYGNWQKDSLKNWKEYLKRLAIKAEQQFDYVSGKNATDIALWVVYVFWDGDNQFVKRNSVNKNFLNHFAPPCRILTY